jgi:glycyl-tRNA synthetase (class II)
MDLSPLAVYPQLAEDLDGARALEAKLAADGLADIVLGEKTLPITRPMVSYTFGEKTVSVVSFMPHVVEPSFGIGRIMTGIFEHCFNVRPGMWGGCLHIVGLRVFAMSEEKCCRPF